LEFLADNDTIDLAHIQTKVMENRKRKKYLNMHSNSIYKGKDGRFHTYLPLDNGKRRKVTKKTLKEVEDAVIEFWEAKANIPTVGMLFDEWNNERLLDRQITRRSFDRYNQVFKRHFTDVSNKRIDKVTSESVINFIRVEKREKDLNRKAFNLFKSSVVGILELADDKEQLPFDYLRFNLALQKTVKKMKFPKQYKDDEDEVFSEEEFDLITDYLKDNMDTKNTALLLMFVTGLRVGELVALKHDAILENTIKICRTETRYLDDDGKKYIYDIQEHPKTEKGYRRIVLPKQYDFLYGRLRKLNPFGEFIFVDDSGKRITANVISRRLKTVCKKLGIRERSPHKVRKTVGTIYFDNHLDKNLTLSQMGWSGEAVGEVHYHRNRKTIEKKIDLVSQCFE